MSKILKNTTGSDIDVVNLGITIPALGQTNLDTREYLLLSSDDVVTELTSLINAGDIVVNDGTTDLPASKGIAYIQYPDNAVNIRFNNSSNGFTSDDVQEAIEEVQDNVENKSIVTLNWNKSGKLSAKDYLYIGKVESNKTGNLVPYDGFITRCLINNDNDSGNKTIEILKRFPAQTGSLTSLGTVTVPNGDSIIVDDISLAVQKNEEILLRASSSSADFKNVIVSITIETNLNGQVGGSFLQTEDEGSLIESTTTKYNFTGSGIVATSDGSGNVTVQFSGGGTPFSSGSVNSNGTTNSVTNATVNRTGTGQYTISFVTNSSTANYPVLLTIEQNSGTDDYQIAYSDVTVSGFDVEVKEQDDGGGGGTFRDSGFSFLVPNISGGTQPQGEANTASNLGSGEGVFAQKTSLDLEFKSLVAGTDINLSSNSDEITINSTVTPGEINTASNLGTGEGIFAQKSGNDLELKSLISTGDGSISSNSNEISINFPTVPTVDSDVNKVTYITDTTGGQSIGNSFVDISFNSSPLTSSVATSSTTEITIQKSGLYLVNYDITIDSVSGSSRTKSQSKLQEDLGSGYVDISGSFRGMYHRTSSQGLDSASCTLYRTYSIGDKIKLQASIISGSGPLATFANGSSLSVQYLRSNN
jgi:phosphopantetheine adenylyltransferase